MPDWIVANRRRSLATWLRAGALGLFGVALAHADLAIAQEETPALTVAPPPGFEVDRAVGPLAFEVAFKLAEGEDANLQILFDEADGAASQQEREIFALDFQPFEGARFVLSRSTRNAPLVSSRLQQVAEPKELQFRLHIDLPQEGGLAVTMADGMPVVIATTPRAQRMKVQFAASGGVTAFTATTAERVTRLKLDAKAEVELARLDALPLPTKHGWASGLGPEVENEPRVSAPLKQVRVVDRQEAADGIVERFVAEFEEGIESPLVIGRPAGDAKVPALLIVAGEPDGIASASVRAALKRGIATGSLVAAFEPIGIGERRSILPHDDLHVPELELVGTSSFDLATIEGLQLVEWLRARPDIDVERLAITGTGIGADIADTVQGIAHDRVKRVVFDKPPVGSSDLPIELVHVGDDYLHLRFDSCQLLRALQRREELPPPDESVSLVDRVTERGNYTILSLGLWTLVLTPGHEPVRWVSAEAPPPFAKHVTIVASDRGMRVALEEAAARLPARDDETLVALDPRGLRFVCLGADSVDLQEFFDHLRKARGPDAVPPRILADGTTALPLLTTMIQWKHGITAANVKFPVESFTACHAIPSFDLLLKRPYTAHRADPALEVLTQGMPDWVFVPNALTRFEIEDVVIALTARGLKVDWQDPVDALRRPLTRHDRLAMWPQFRHAEFVRPR